MGLINAIFCMIPYIKLSSCYYIETDNNIEFINPVMDYEIN